MVIEGDSSDTRRRISTAHGSVEDSVLMGDDMDTTEGTVSSSPSREAVTARLSSKPKPVEAVEAPDAFQWCV